VLGKPALPAGARLYDACGRKAAGNRSGVYYLVGPDGQKVLAR